MSLERVVLSDQLKNLITQYRKRFAGDSGDGFSLNETTLGQEALVARLEQALAEGKPYDPQSEEWSPDFRAKVETGSIQL